MNREIVVEWFQFSNFVSVIDLDPEIHNVFFIRPSGSYDIGDTRDSD